MLFNLRVICALHEDEIYRCDSTWHKYTIITKRCKPFMHEYNPHKRRLKDKKRSLEKMFLAGASLGYEKVTQYDYPVEITCKDCVVEGVFVDSFATEYSYARTKIYKKATKYLRQLQTQCKSEDFILTSPCNGVYIVWQVMYFALCDCIYSDGYVTQVKVPVSKQFHDLDNDCKQFNAPQIFIHDVKHMFARRQRTEFDRLQKYSELRQRCYNQSKKYGAKRWTGNNRQDARIELSEITKIYNNTRHTGDDNIGNNIECIRRGKKDIHKQYSEYIY